MNPVLTTDERDLPEATCYNAMTDVPRGILRVTKGVLNGREVRVLLDGGADSIFFAKGLVSPQCYTGGTLRTRVATQTIDKCPVARVNFSCPYFPGGETLAVELDGLDYDVLLGRVRGTSNFEEPPPRDLQPTVHPESQVPEDTNTQETPETEINNTEAMSPASSDGTSHCMATTRAQSRREETALEEESIQGSTTDERSLEANPPSIPNAMEFGAAQRECPSLKKLRQQASSRAEHYERGGAMSRIIERGGIYYRIHLHHGIRHEQLLVPLQYRAEVLNLAHENPLSGHFGVEKTKERVLREFYWPQVEQDVVKRYRECTTCCRMSPKRHAKVPMGTPALATEPFSAVSIDLVGPLSPTSSEGHRYILTMVDQATRYPDAVPLRHIDSQSVADALCQMFSYTGYPQQLTSDNGTQFTSGMFEAFLRSIGTVHLKTPVYHAQSNGLVERFNGTLKTVLKKLTSEKPRDWHKHLPALLFAFRDAQHSSTGFSPFELIYGHRVRGPLAFLRACWSSSEVITKEDVDNHQYVTDMKERLKQTCALARQNLNQAQVKYKTQFDKRTKIRSFKAGTKVLVFLPTSSHKLLMKWKGPFKILSRLGSFLYKLDVPGNNKMYHINLLKEYTPTSDDDASPDIPTTPDEREATTEEITEEDQDVDDPEELQDGQGSSHTYDGISPVYAAVAIATESSDDYNLDDKDPTIPRKTVETYEDCVLGPDLSDSKRKDLLDLLEMHQNTLSSVPGLTATVEHRLKIMDNDTFQLQHSYPVPLALDDVLRQELNKWMELDIIEKSDSPYCSPLLAVRKPDGTHRFCLDCRILNSQTVHDQEPISDPHQIFSSIAKARWFTKVDLTSGYWQVPLNPESRPYTAFRTRHGLYQFKVMPFGLVNAPATFSRLMRKVTEDLQDTYCYLDDVLIASSDWESHLQRIDDLFNALKNHGLHAKPSKCELGCQKLTYLGHIVGEGYTQPLHDRIEAIAATEAPKNKKQLRSFLGSVGYYQRFIRNYSHLIKPLTDFLKQQRPDIIQWTDVTYEAFDALRKVLIDKPVLQLPDINCPFILQTDASNIGLGAVLLQPCKHDPRILAPVAYASRLLQNAEINYSVIEREGLAVYWALQKFFIYLYGRHFTLRTDHKPLLYLGQADKLNPRLKRWATYIGLYRFTPEYVKGEDNCLPDYLSRSATR